MKDPVNARPIQANTTNEEGPVVPAHVQLPEITLRAVILGSFLTIILAAANAYLGLKVGTTVSASIPAAVISMGILRFFRNANVLENTMVQIMASVGEALTAGVAFILPALIILHIWEGFNYWQTVITTLLGGILGVLFTVPLRRALLRDKSLRYPEAIAIGNVLRASHRSEKGDLALLTWGGAVGAIIGLFQSGFQVLADNFSYWTKTNTTIVGFGLGFSPALIAAGYIVGINVAISVLVGVVIGWIAGVPWIVSAYGLLNASTANQIAMDTWRDYIRYMGVGTMLIGGLWTLCTLFNPVLQSMVTSFRSLKKARLEQGALYLRTERDMPIQYVFISLLILLVPIFLLVAFTIVPGAYHLPLSVRSYIAGFSTLYVLVGGFVFCSVSAYFAGLIGSTNNPVSGMLVATLLLICLAFMVFFNLLTTWSASTKEMIGTVVAIGSMAIIGGALAISNDTMQDLKVGEMMGATPWKQQTMLLLGVLVSAFVIAPILQLLYNAYGIGGAFPRPNMDPSQMLAAPQAGLMAAVAKGIFSYELKWGMIAIGAVIAAICIVIDEILKKRFQTRLPVLAVGLGIYLPLDSSVPIVIGGLLTYLIESRINKLYRRGNLQEEEKVRRHRHRALLMSCGIVAGASLIGVVLAIPFAIKESSDALRIMPVTFMPYAGLLSIIVTLLLCAWIYRIALKAQ